jgi:hypothetical protein
MNFNANKISHEYAQIVLDLRFISDSRDSETIQT